MAMTPSWKVTASGGSAVAAARRGRPTAISAMALRRFMPASSAAEPGGGRAELAAGAGRGRQLAVADLDAHVAQRHAQGLGGDLGQHGVGAGADVGHALATVITPVGVDA